MPGHVPNVASPRGPRNYLASPDEGGFPLDAGTGTLTLTGSAVESFVYTDSGAGTLTIGGTRSESAVYTTVTAGTLTLAGSRSESETHSASLAGTLTFSRGSSPESHLESGVSDSVDTQSIEFTLTGSATQSQTHTGSGTGTITFSGTAAQSHTHSRTAAGTLTVSGAGSESSTHTRAATGAITLDSWAVSTVGAYPGAFYPGQVYPAQLYPETAVGAGSAAGTVTLDGTGADIFTSGGTVYNDTATGTLTLDGDAVDEALGPPWEGIVNLILDGLGLLETVVSIRPRNLTNVRRLRKPPGPFA